MPRPFAALETRLNAAVAKHLANAAMAWVGGNSAEGQFDADYQDVLGVSAATPAFLAASDVLVGIERGVRVTITCEPLSLVDAPYIVTELQPEHGLVRVMLRKVT